MMKMLGATIAGLVASVLWTSNAFAVCSLGQLDCGGGGAVAGAPEIDGPGALTAVALLVSLGAIIYRNARK